MQKPKELLQPEMYYHVYNHANGNEKLFREERNYPFFMEKIENWVVPCCDILAYCLIPNHFHFAVRVKKENILEKLFEDKIHDKLKKLTVVHGKRFNVSAYDLFNESELKVYKSEIIQQLVSQQFSHCFNSYVQAFNKTYDRMGSLIKQAFQRKAVNNNDYLQTLICYIHNNPVNHKIVKSTELWKHSSYLDLFHNNKTIIQREEVIEIFSNLENLVKIHKEKIKRPGRI